MFFFSILASNIFHCIKCEHWYYTCTAFVFFLVGMIEYTFLILFFLKFHTIIYEHFKTIEERHRRKYNKEGRGIEMNTRRNVTEKEEEREREGRARSYGDREVQRYQAE